MKQLDCLISGGRLHVFLIMAFIIFFIGRALSSETPADRLASGTIIAVVPSDAPPAYFRDEKTGKASGFSVDITDLLAERAGLKVQYVFGGGWTDIIRLVDKGEADLIPVMGISEERKKTLAFTDEVDSFPISFFVHSHRNIKDWTPENRTVGVISGSIAYERLRDRPGISFRMYESFELGMYDLLAGKMDAFACPAPIFLQLTRDADLEDHFRQIEKPIDIIHRAIAVHKGNTELLKRLNKAMEGFAGSEEYKHIYTKWYGSPPPFWTQNRIIGAGAGLVLITIIIMAVWRYMTIVGLNTELKSAIAERDRSETARQESETRYQKIFNTVQDVIYQTDAAGNFVDISPSILAHSGYSREELIGKPAASFYVNPEDRSRLLLELQENGRVNDHELLLKAKDGRLVNASLNARLVIDASGAVSGVEGILRDITDRKRAETELRSNQERLQSLVRIAQYPSDNIHDLLDFALEEAIRLTGSRIGYIYFYSEEKREFTLNSWSKDVMKECTITEPQTVYQLDRTGIWGEAVRQRRPVILQDFQSFHPLKRGYPEGHAPLHRFLTIPVFQGNSIVAVVGVANKAEPYNNGDETQLTLLMDTVWRIAEKKNIERELKEREAVLSSFMNAIAESAALIAKDGSVITANETFAGRLGRTLSDVIGKNVYEMIPHEVAARRKAHVDQVFNSGSPARFEDERSGMHLDNSVYPVFDPQGNVVSAAIVGIDITDRKKAEDVLKVSEKKLRDITSSQGEGLYVINNRGEVTFMNPEAERLLGWTEAEIKGKNVHDLVHSRNADGSYLSFEDCQMRRVIETGERYKSGNEVFISRDGRVFPVSVISAPLWENGEIVASITSFRDISERKKLEKEREDLIAELQKAVNEIKTLHGILPICSFCKKIKDEKGAWHQMEAYIRDHTDADFSHGLCAECAQKFYPDYFRKMQE